MLPLSTAVTCSCRCELHSNLNEVKKSNFLALHLSLIPLIGRTHEKIYKTKQAPPLHNQYNSRDAFRLGTLGGAEALNMADQIGTIEVGKKADLLIFDAMTANLAGIRDPFQGIVFHASDADITTVLVDGEIVKKDGKLAKFEWATVAQELVGRAEGLRERFPDHELEERWQKYHAQSDGPTQWAK